jgi:hypothetical protein
MGDLLGGLYPLQHQWEGQHEALIKYGKGIKNCAQLVVERPGWALTKNCYEQASIREKTTLARTCFLTQRLGDDIHKKHH